MVRRLVLFSICFLCNIMILKSQNQETIMQQHISSLIDYLNSTKEEKLYIHTDKESCFVGDTIWFKGYLIGAATHTIADLSRYIYVELTDRNNTVYWREKVALSGHDSVFQGYFPVSEDIAQGEYFLRGYTYWMQNSDEDFLCVKRIRVVNRFDHRIVPHVEVEHQGRNERVIKLSFLNNKGERYENVPLFYSIPGDTTRELRTANTGYNGLIRIPIHHNVNRIWVRFSNDAKWDYEGFITIPNEEMDFSVDFFPEGGDLISGFKQRIAFKCLGVDGLGVATKGVVKRGDGSIVFHVSSNHLGMGSFIVDTDSCKEYFAEFTSSDNIKRVLQLPLPTDNDNRLALTLQTENANVVCSVLGMESAYENKYIVIHSRGIPIGIYPVVSIRDKVLDLSGAPEGIITFALVDELGNTCSERLWFHRKEHRAAIDIAPLDNRVKLRSDAKIKLNLLSDSEWNSVKGNFSISVINNGQSSNDINNAGIESYILLKSDIKGYIENPDYYFESYNKERLKALDDLLLTQGWKRFDLSTILTGDAEFVPLFYMERGLFLSGHVNNYRGKSIYNSNIILIGTNGIARKLLTDSLGNFIENDIWYNSSTRFIVQALTEKGSDRLELQLDEPQYRNFNNFIPLGACLGDVDFYKKYSRDYIFDDNGERISTIGVVTVGGSPKTAMQDILDRYVEEQSRKHFLMGMTGVSTFGQAPGSQMIHIDGRAQAMRYYDNLLRGIANNDRSLLPDYYGNWTGSGIDGLIDIDEQSVAAYNELIDKQRVSQGERATTLVHNDAVAKPRILGMKAHAFRNDIMDLRGKNAEYWGGYYFTPVYDEVVVNNIDMQFNMQTIVPFAPQEPKEFYVPSYDVKSESLKQPVDEIITRYWNPSVNLMSGESYIFEFPTADGVGNQVYTVLVEGLTDSGLPIRQVYTYQL